MDRERRRVVISTFFDRHVGPGCEQKAEVTLAIGAAPISPMIRIDLNVEDPDAMPSVITPDQAKALGRALIKAGKFAAKPAKK
jgi:hypothetical protein